MFMNLHYNLTAKDIDWANFDYEKAITALNELSIKWEREMQEIKDQEMVHRSLLIRFNEAIQAEKEGDIYKAILLHEMNLGMIRCPSETPYYLARLYRKIKNIPQQIRVLQYALEDERNKAHKRMMFCCMKEPENTDEIISHFNENKPYLNSFGFVIDFHKKTQTVENKLQKLYSKNIK